MGMGGPGGPQATTNATARTDMSGRTYGEGAPSTSAGFTPFSMPPKGAGPFGAGATSEVTPGEAPGAPKSRFGNLWEGLKKVDPRVWFGLAAGLDETNVMARNMYNYLTTEKGEKLAAQKQRLGETKLDETKRMNEARINHFKAQEGEHKEFDTFYNNFIDSGGNPANADEVYQAHRHAQKNPSEWDSYYQEHYIEKGEPIDTVIEGFTKEKGSGKIKSQQQIDQDLDEYEKKEKIKKKYRKEEKTKFQKDWEYRTNPDTGKHERRRIRFNPDTGDDEATPNAQWSEVPAETSQEIKNKGKRNVRGEMHKKGKDQSTKQELTPSEKKTLTGKRAGKYEVNGKTVNWDGEKEIK
jgi:hypothetical protein